jgi:predicted dehydrogenase
MKIGILGYGSIGRRHGMNLSDLGYKDWIAYDPHKNAAAWLGDKLKSREEVLAADAVIIATPSEEHFTDLNAVGHITPVLVEKPIATGCPDLLEKLLSVRSLTMVGCQLRFNPCVKIAKDWLEQGRIGTILWGDFVLSQHTDNETYLKDGVLLSWGSHEIDLAHYLLGDPMLRACVANDDNLAQVILDHGGALSRLHLDFVGKVRRRAFSIGGTEGNLRVDLERRTAMLDRVDGDNEHHQYDGPHNNDYRAEIAAFVRSVESGEAGFAPGATGQDGLSTFELILEAQACEL